MEMIYPGGEVEFVTQLIEESTITSNRAMFHWFSSMFGKLGSVNTIIERLKEKGCTNYAVTEFVQGQRTRRWCVAWSWSGLRPSNAVARGTDAVEKKYLPFPTEIDITIDSSTSEVNEALQEEIPELRDIQWQWNAQTQTGIGRSMAGDVWSRKARRRLEKKAAEDSMEIDTPQSTSKSGSDQVSGERHQVQERETGNDSQFVFKITIDSVQEGGPKDHSATRNVMVNLRWLYGHDSIVFESFHGWLKRKLQDC